MSENLLIWACTIIYRWDIYCNFILNWLSVKYSQIMWSVLLNEYVNFSGETVVIKYLHLNVGIRWKSTQVTLPLNKVDMVSLFVLFIWQFVCKWGGKARLDRCLYKLKSICSANFTNYANIAKSLAAPFKSWYCMSMRCKCMVCLYYTYRSQFSFSHEGICGPKAQILERLPSSPNKWVFNTVVFHTSLSYSESNKV